MEVNSAKLKYKSSVNLFLAIFLGLYQIVIVLLLTSPIFADSTLGLRWGILLAILDAAVFIPMLFLVRYEIRSDCLYVSDYPFGFYKISYEDILSVDEDVSPKEKHVKKVGLSTRYIAISYRKFKKGAYETRRMLISPSDKDSFLVFLKSKVNLDAKKENKEVLEEKKSEKTKKEEKAPASNKNKKPEQKPSVNIQNKEIKKPEKELENLQKMDAEEKEVVIEQPKTNAAFFTVEDDEEKPL